MFAFERMTSFQARWFWREIEIAIWREISALALVNEQEIVCVCQVCADCVVVTVCARERASACAVVVVACRRPNYRFRYRRRLALCPPAAIAESTNEVSSEKKLTSGTQTRWKAKHRQHNQNYKSNAQ